MLSLRFVRFFYKEKHLVIVILLLIVQVTAKKKTTIKKTKEVEKKDNKGRGIAVDGITDYKWVLQTSSFSTMHIFYLFK